LNTLGYEHLSNTNYRCHCYKKTLLHINKSVVKTSNRISQTHYSNITI